MTGFIIWYLFGMLGGYFIWLSWKWEFPFDAGDCPTRKGAFGIFVSGVLGPTSFIVGLILVLLGWIEHREETSDSRWKRWWNTPLCRSKGEDK